MNRYTKTSEYLIAFRAKSCSSCLRTTAATKNITTEDVSAISVGYDHHKDAVEVMI